MKSNYKPIGDLVTRVDNRNKGAAISKLLGLSIDKKFIPSVANTIGTDLSSYKIIQKNDFAVSLMQVSRDSKIPVACQKEYEAAIMSPAYSIFRVKDTDEILPDYLEMWFKRSEFDREAAFIAVGGVRGSMPWEEFAGIKVYVPNIEQQEKLVRQYKTISDRIVLKQRINDNLEATISTIFESYFMTTSDNFKEFEFGAYPANWHIDTIDNVIDVRDGTHDSPEATKTGKFLITSRHLMPYGIKYDDAYFISETDYKRINERSKVEHGDILFSMIGTIGLISLITDQIIDFAIKNVGLFRTSQEPEMRYYVLSYLKSNIVNRYILSVISGSTQSYVSLSALRKIPIVLPPQKIIQEFNKKVTFLFNLLINNTMELQNLSSANNLLLTTISR